MLQNEIKHLTFKVCNLSITLFLKSTQQGGLEICGMYTDSIVFKQQTYCSF